MQFASIGDIATLTEDWTFTLFSESRNTKFWDLHKYANMKSYGNSMYVTLPAGTSLVVDRIYIRKGKKDYDSITFRIKEHQNKKLMKKSFWAKLYDVRNMKSTIEEASCKLNTERINQLKRNTNSGQYKTMRDCIFAVSDVKYQPEKDGPEFWITSYGIGCLLPTHDVIIGNEAATYLSDPSSKTAIVLNVQCESIYNSMVTEYIECEVIVGVLSNGEYDYYRASTMNGVSVFKMTESNRKYLDGELNKLLGQPSSNVDS